MTNDELRYIIAKLSDTNAAIAQSVERILGKDEVASSNLASSSKTLKSIGFQGFFLFFTKSQSASLLYNYLEKGCAFVMSKKITIRGHSTQTYAEVFQSFISAKTAQGVADITIRNYHNNLHVISKYLDTSRPLGEITKWDIDEMIVSMRRAGLAQLHFHLCSHCPAHPRKHINSHFQDRAFS